MADSQTIKPKSHWIWHIVYFNPEDKRVIVPMRSKLGWSVNFGNPRAVTVLGWICGVALLVYLTIPIIAHPSYFAKNQTALYWVLTAYLAALVFIRLNGSFTWSDYRNLHLAAYGILAAGIAFGIQGIINTPLVLLWSAKKLFWLRLLILTLVAAGAQTFGKWAAIVLLQKVKPTSTKNDYIRYGLFIGLGFTVWEITLIYFAVAWSQAPLGYLSVWERLSASLFHIYSGGLIALALWSRRYWLIALVVIIHTITDFLAGSGIQFSIYTIESIFSIIVVITWFIFLIATRVITAPKQENKSSIG